MTDPTPGSGCPEALEAARDQIDNLQIALQSSRRIGEAVGIIMAAAKITEDDAFQTLVRASQQQNRKVRQVADDVVEYGTI